MTTVTRRRSQPAAGWSDPYVPQEELAFLSMWQPSVLIAGAPETTAAALAALRPVLRAPVFEWDAARRFDLPTTMLAGTLILNDVAALTGAGQRRLHAWLQAAGRETQVVTLTALPLLPLVAGGHFDAG